jgi:hypothetical protein
VNYLKEKQYDYKPTPVSENVSDSQISDSSEEYGLQLLTLYVLKGCEYCYFG